MAKPTAGGIAIDYAAAQARLDRLFDQAEAEVDSPWPAALAPATTEAAERVFASPTQSFREVLLGCALARLQDTTVDVTLPYVGHGPRAFNGRTLDERVVNPSLKIRRIPSSKGPYLATFRRSVRLDQATAEGVRDKAGYRAMLVVVDALASADASRTESLALHLCIRFVRLRNASRIPLVQVLRLTLDQLLGILDRLMAQPSGGRWPVFFAAAMFETLRERFAQPWDVAVQGINEADAATGAGGDIVIRNRDTGDTVLAVEVTLREIDGSRVVATVASKIAVNLIAEYLFLHAGAAPTADARSAAFGYFAQGRDIAFLRIEPWLAACLATVGAAGRALFVTRLLARLDEPDVPAAMKLAWNRAAEALGRPQPG